MCGIVFVKESNNRQALANVLSLYAAQRQRGSQGFGIVSIGGTDRAEVWHGPNEKDFYNELLTVNSPMLLIHHRMPTSNINVKHSCHPFSIEVDKKIYHTVHNGVVGNPEEVFKIFPAYKPTSVAPTWIQGHSCANDSEAFALELAHFIPGKINYLTSSGSMAFVTIQTDKAGVIENIYFGADAYSSLSYMIKENQIAIASELIQSVATAKHCADDVIYQLDMKTHALTELKKLKYATILIPRGSSRSKGRYNWHGGRGDDDFDEAYNPYISRSDDMPNNWLTSKNMNYLDEISRWLGHPDILVKTTQSQIDTFTSELWLAESVIDIGLMKTKLTSYMETYYKRLENLKDREKKHKGLSRRQRGKLERTENCVLIIEQLLELTDDRLQLEIDDKKLESAPTTSSGTTKLIV